MNAIDLYVITADGEITDEIRKVIVEYLGDLDEDMEVDSGLWVFVDGDGWDEDGLRRFADKLAAVCGKCQFNVLLDFEIDGERWLSGFEYDGNQLTQTF